MSRPGGRFDPEFEDGVVRIAHETGQRSRGEAQSLAPLWKLTSCIPIGEQILLPTEVESWPKPR